MPRRIYRILPVLAALSPLPVAAAPDVAASIAPVHSLAAMVMKGVGEPDLIVPAGASPHGHALRPSEARAVERAQVVFRIGPTLETMLDRPLQALATDARVVDLAKIEGTVVLPTRDDPAWTPHGTDHGHGHDHGDDDHDRGHGHDDGHGHDHGDEDPHLWLDPANARVWVDAIATVLAEIDPGNADTYRANADTAREQLNDLEGKVEARLAPVIDVPYVVFHDAYQYFENRFGTNAIGSIAVYHAAQPGAARLSRIREHVRETGAVCAFAEPQFEPRLVRTVIEGTEARTGILDPVGADLEPGPDLYFALLTDLADDLRTCLED